MEWWNVEPLGYTIAQEAGCLGKDRRDRKE